MADEEIQEGGDVPVVETAVVETPKQPTIVDQQVEQSAPQPAATTSAWPKSAIDQISSERSRRQAETAARETAERQLREANEMLERLQKGDKSAAQPAAATTRPATYQADVSAAAAHQRMVEDSAALLNTGRATVKSFDERVGVLNGLGVTSDDFVIDLLAADKANAHLIIDKLAQDPERAVQIARMDSKSRIVALTRMGMAMSEQQAAKPAVVQEAPKPAKVSLAPAPKPVLDPANAAQHDWMSDDASDEAFFEGFKQKYKIA